MVSLISEQATHMYVLDRNTGKRDRQTDREGEEGGRGRQRGREIV